MHLIVYVGTSSLKQYSLNFQRSITFACLLPEIYNFCLLSYGADTFLSFHDNYIFSAEGVQQGDPLGPLLFSMTAHPLLCKLNSAFKVGYLDDFGLGGSLNVLEDDLNFVINHSKQYGLTLNLDKCVVCSDSNNISFQRLGSLKQLRGPDLDFLGSPVFEGVVQNTHLEKMFTIFDDVLNKLSLISLHDALCMLQHAVYIPKLIYFLRTSPNPNETVLNKFTTLLRSRMEIIFNISFNEMGWLQAQLPVSLGGMGIGSMVELAPSAFLASAAATTNLQNSMLPAGFVDVDKTRISIFESLCTRSNLEFDINNSVQYLWQKPFLERSHQTVSSAASSNFDRARLLAVGSDLGSAWLKVRPNSACDTRLDDGCVRMSIGLRLGLPIVAPHVCQCGGEVSPLGYHGLSCNLGPGRQSRHAAMNDLIVKLLQRAGIAAIKEPPGLVDQNNLRPDGFTVVPWSQGRCLAWDVTFPNTMAERYINVSKDICGGAAVKAADFKNNKYSSLRDNKSFLPIVIETFGPTDESTKVFFNELINKIINISNDKNEHLYIKGSISCLLQKFNTFCILDNCNRHNQPQSVEAT